MQFRRLLPVLIVIIGLPAIGFSQEKVTRSDDKTNQSKVIQDNQRKGTADKVKTVPMMNKNIDAIRMMNKKATMEQMHTINKAMRKSMKINKHR